MSDGNFNRALLPSTPYASGLKMGRQQMKALASKAFDNIIKEKFPALSDEELKELSATFQKQLTSP